MWLVRTDSIAWDARCATSSTPLPSAAALTDHLVLDGIELVIVEATFWTESERDELTNRLTTLVHPAFPDAAGRRRGGAPARTGRHRPTSLAQYVFLHASHADSDALTPIATDAIIDLTSLPVDAVVAAIMAVLEHASAPDTGGALFNNIDCVQFPVPDLDAGLDFYRNALGGVRQPDLVADPTVGLHVRLLRSEPHQAQDGLYHSVHRHSGVHLLRCDSSQHRLDCLLCAAGPSLLRWAVFRTGSSSW
jgi:hypothetical protein